MTTVLHIHALCVSEWVKWHCSCKLSLFSTLGKNKPNRRVIVISYTSAYVDASGRRTQPPSVCDTETEEKRQRNREVRILCFLCRLSLETENNKPTLFWIDADYFESLASTEENVSHRANEHFLNVFKKNVSWPRLPWALIAPHLKSPITSLHTAPRRRSALSCRAARRVFQRCIKVWRLNKKAPVLQIRVDDKIKL